MDKTKLKAKAEELIRVAMTDTALHVGGKATKELAAKGTAELFVFIDALIALSVACKEWCDCPTTGEDIAAEKIFAALSRLEELTK